MSSSSDGEQNKAHSEPRVHQFAHHSFALPAHAQPKLTHQTFTKAFFQAYRTGNQEKADKLVHENKNLAFRVINILLGESLPKKKENTQTVLLAAETMAESYKRVFRDNFLAIQVDLYRS